jgi:hypothetical protein
MENENLNTEETANSCALLEELQLKLIAMSCFAQEHFNEKAYDVTKMNIDEIKHWIKEKTHWLTFMKDSAYYIRENSDDTYSVVRRGSYELEMLTSTKSICEEWIANHG